MLQYVTGKKPNTLMMMCVEVLATELAFDLKPSWGR
jgi:hypothetical protein